MKIKIKVNELANVVKPIPNNISKCFIVFDMDECIASIHAYAILLDILYSSSSSISQSLYNQYFDYMFNDLISNFKNYQYLRPGTIDVFTLIYFFKLLCNQNDIILKCLIYTNNGLEPLVQMVIKIINSLVGYNVIDDYVYRESECKLDKGSPSRLQKRIEHLKTCIGSDVNIDNVLFFDNDNYPIFKKQLGNNYVQVSPYYNLDSIILYNYYNNHIRFILTNRLYRGVFTLVEGFNSNLELIINKYIGKKYGKNNDSFELIIPSIINFIGITSLGNKFLLEYLANIYF